ncbi:glycosyltransferase [Thermoanaerobacterium sp. RBIITD]
MLPVNTSNTHDYIKASKLIITKAGWSTISEAICVRKPIIVLDLR